MASLPETDLDVTQYDGARMVWWRTERGLQPVIWPMVLHKHTQECRRA